MNRRNLIAEEPFEFSARVTLQLGRESISNSISAISELIKNSYDADAEDVSLDFNLRSPTAVSTLVITDNGNGMSVSTIFEHWLKIGTDNKATNDRSEYKKRVLTGAKGLGRLGIDKLCKKLVLYSKSKGDSKAVQLNIDWKQFEDASKNLSDIRHKIYEVDLPITDKYGTFFNDSEESGTRLILIGLRDDWKDGLLGPLENELRLLVSPFQAKNDFSINLKIKSNGQLQEKTVSSEEFLSIARWKARATLDERGYISACFSNNQKQFDVLQEPIHWSNWIKNKGLEPMFGPITFEFYYLAQDPTSLSKLNLKVRNFRDFMRLNQGVRLYRDHFRVRPYGEPSGKGDWLDLGLRRAANPQGVSQPGWKIGPNQVVGYVLISREQNSVLNDQANREGIVENNAFYQLRTFLLKVIETFEALVQKDAAGDNKTDLAEELATILSKSNQDIGNTIENIKQSVSKISRKKVKNKKILSHEQQVRAYLTELETLRERQKNIEQKYLSALQNEKQNLETQKNTLSNLASIGILTISFGHEVRQHSGLALNGSSVAIKQLHRLNDASNFLSKPIELLDVVHESARYIDNFSKFAIENIKPDKRTRKKVKIPDVFNNVFEMFSSTLDKMGIQTSVNVTPVNSTHEVYAFEIDWESIAINFMTNSIWAIESSSNRAISEISVEINETDEYLLVYYKDSGIGLEAGTEETIFHPMHTGKRDNIGNSIGTGMGLSIVKTHIEDHMNGTIVALPTSNLGGAEFRISIPKGGRK